MDTYIYMVRHGESPKVNENERTRGLTEKGKINACKVTKILEEEGIDTFISSPYARAVLTIEELARLSNKEVLIYENLKECVFSNEDKIIPNEEIYPLVKKMFENPDFTTQGGESYTQCLNRSVSTLKEILNNFQGNRIVIGTHGFVMTLMISHFDNRYGLDFLMETSKPDIYKMKFNGENLINIERMWSS